MKDIYGKWPGDETEEELLSALEEMDTPEQRSPMMPGEFKLRPVETDSCNIHDVDDYNDYHEQGARALAAAIVAEVEKGGPLDPVGNPVDSGAEWVIRIIHRLVPPKEKA